MVEWPSDILNLVFIVLFSLGIIGTVRFSYLNKIKRKPFSCDFCISFWASLFYAALMCIYDFSEYIFALPPDMRSFSVIWSMVYYQVFRLVAFGFIGAGSIYLMLRIVQHFANPMQGHTEKSEDLPIDYTNNTPAS